MHAAQGQMPLPQEENGDFHARWCPHAPVNAPQWANYDGNGGGDYNPAYDPRTNWGHCCRCHASHSLGGCPDDSVPYGGPAQQCRTELANVMPYEGFHPYAYAAYGPGFNQAGPSNGLVHYGNYLAPAAAPLDPAAAPFDPAPAPFDPAAAPFSPPAVPATPEDIAAQQAAYEAASQGPESPAASYVGTPFQAVSPASAATPQGTVEAATPQQIVEASEAGEEDEEIEDGEIREDDDEADNMDSEADYTYSESDYMDSEGDTLSSYGFDNFRDDDDDERSVVDYMYGGRSVSVSDAGNMDRDDDHEDGSWCFGNGVEADFDERLTKDQVWVWRKGEATKRFRGRPLPAREPVANLSYRLPLTNTRDPYTAPGEEHICGFEGCTATGNGRRWLQQHIEGPAHFDLHTMCTICGRADPVGQFRREEHALECRYMQFGADKTKLHPMFVQLIKTGCLNAVCVRNAELFERSKNRQRQSWEAKGEDITVHYRKEAIESEMDAGEANMRALSAEKAAAEALAEKELLAQRYEESMIAMQKNMDIMEEALRLTGHGHLYRRRF